ncbi:MAG: hypothetical protein QM658_00045 [Gordonia sp. (in: high G+C Gram-positive bacteria)]
MTTTTIKLSTSLRDRLKRQAHAAGRTLGEQVEHLADLGDRAERFEQLSDALAATSEADMASYRAEVAEWESVDGC